jgi:hypothetical protein
VQLPLQTTYWLNGHSFMEQELNRAGVGFRKNDNTFLVVDDVKALQAAVDRLSAGIRPKFSHRECQRMNPPVA